MKLNIDNIQKKLIDKKLILKGQQGLNTNFMLFDTPKKEKKSLHTYPNTITIKDNRIIRRTTNNKINPNVDLKTGIYDSNIIHDIIKAAKDRNYDPLRALAVSMVESNLGKYDNNLGHTTSLFPEVLSNKKSKPTASENMINGLIFKKNLANKNGYTSPEMELQYYNGLGKIYPTTESTYHSMTGRGAIQKKFYGVPVTSKGIDMKKEMLYGKEVEDIRKMLSNNKDIQTMIDTVNVPDLSKYFKLIPKVNI